MKIIIDKNFAFDLAFLEKQELQKISQKEVIFGDLVLSIDNVCFGLCVFLLFYDGRYMLIASSFTTEENYSVDWFKQRFSFLVPKKNQREVDIFARAFLQEGGVREGGLQERGLQERGVREGGLRERGVRERGLQERGLQERGLQERGLQERGLQERGLQNGGLLKEGGLQNGSLLKEGGLQNGGLLKEGSLKNNNNHHLRLLLVGTKFRLKVWKSLLSVGLGETCSYKSLAKRCHLLNPQNSSRAIGGAMAANNISYIVPCHRILRADMALGGYFWGIETKKKLLAAEKNLLKEKKI